MKVPLPSGTVTFLFTDVEGSTGLLDELGADRYAGVIAEQQRLIREASAAHGGAVVDTEGDAFFAAFPTADGALAAAESVQGALGAGLVRMRMGLHTGTPLLTDAGYVGMDVHRAARIAAAAHGGQVVASSSTRSLVDGRFAFVDLGEHRFKDLAEPERVFQLGEGEFPPLRSLYLTNLPVPATVFLGRERELGEVAGLLRRDDVRVLTLTGPGGMGKTRLALQAAAEVADDHRDGVWWTPLAELRDPALVLPSVAQALDVREETNRELVETLVTRLAGKELLMLIDNAEHLLPQLATDVADLVAACPTLTVLVTSRERLQVTAETAWPVPPLDPSDGERFFVERARSAGVVVKVDRTVRELCRRLDELPLALELAAARTVVFSPQQLLRRLGQRLDLLKGGRDADPRQQTLRSTIDWSHDLLDADEQALFRRMSVFAGGCRLESAEEVAGADPDVLQSLLDKSLLQRRDRDGRPRFSMLETVREFAAERLAAAGEVDERQRRHLDHYAAVADCCFDKTWRGHDDLERLTEDRENLRLALDMALSTYPEVGLELAPKLVPFWFQRGDWREARERLAAVLARASDAPTAARAQALRAAAHLASDHSDLDVADSLAYEALGLFRELDDQRGIGLTLDVLGWTAFFGGDYGEARRLFEEAVEAFVSADDEQLHRAALGYLAGALNAQGEHTRAVTLLREVVSGIRREGSVPVLAMALNNLGVAEEMAGETGRAIWSLEESVAVSRRGADKPGLSLALSSLAHIIRATAPTASLAHYSESLRLCREMDDRRGIAYCLEGGAAVVAAGGNATQAAGLLGAASAIRAQTGLAVTPYEQAEIDVVKAQCQEALAAERFSRAWENGAALDAAGAAEWALHAWEQAD